MAVLESEDYEETRKRLVQDPIVRDMAGGVKAVPLLEIAHQDENGTFVPRFEFMMAANREYISRVTDDSHPRHIGAVAEAILRILVANKD